MALVDALARHTDEPGRLTRLYLSPAHRATAEATLGMMREAGLEARIDAAGNVIGRREGRERGAPALIIGSHLDSVVDAGRFDGPLGVVAGIVAAEALAREGPLPFAIEVAAFGDEENVRFPTNLSTSYALAGRYRPEWLDARDGDGVALRDALLAFGGDPDAVAALARRREDVVGYLEVHIEQGPLLESKDLAVGIVSAIAGITRARALVTGEAGHAGTVPMAMRRDALAAAAEMIAAVERIGARRADTVATVGAAQVRPGAVNVIAGEVAFTIDARAPEDTVRKAMVAEIEGALRGHRRTARGRPSRSTPSWTRPRPSWIRGSPRSSRMPPRRSAFRRCGSPPAPATTPSRWRRSVPSPCCSCAARAGSATTRPS